MNVKQPAFRPNPAATTSLAVTSVTGNRQVQAASLTGHVRVFNTGTVTVFIEMSNSSGVAATVPNGATPGSYPLAAGAVEVIACPLQYIAAITVSGTATLYFTPGEGL